MICTPKLRTINGAWEELKALDSGCQVSQGFIRYLVSAGTVPSIKSGNRQLIDLEVLLTILANLASGTEVRNEK